jgi:hypothetical protein
MSGNFEPREHDRGMVFRGSLITSRRVEMGADETTGDGEVEVVAMEMGWRRSGRPQENTRERKNGIQYMCRMWLSENKREVSNPREHNT